MRFEQMPARPDKMLTRPYPHDFLGDVVGSADQSTKSTPVLVEVPREASSADGCSPDTDGQQTTRSLLLRHGHVNTVFSLQKFSVMS
jgi:hypothetical protein